MQRKLEKEGESNTLPKTIHVRRNDGPGSLVTTPRASPRRRVTGNSSMIPVEVESDPASPRELKEIIVVNEQMSLHIEEVREDTVIPEVKEEPQPVLKEGHMFCPFKMLGCQKSGQQREVQLHLRDDRHHFRDYHMILMHNNLTKFGKEVQDSCIVHYDETQKYWLGLDRATLAARKYGAQYIFKINDISRAMLKSCRNPKGANLIYSDIFESHRFGYKMVAIVSPFGDGKARTEYISIFAAIIKGDYDAILQWPFPCPVTFALRIPGTEKKFEKTLDPVDTPHLEKFGRPVKGRNRVFGFQMFCPIAELAQFSVMDDLYLEIYVDLTKMGKNKTKKD